MARLVIFDDRVRGLELPQRPVLIGRSHKNDIPINDQLLSRKHCSVVPFGSGYRLMDLKSSNGTYLNGKKVQEKADLKVDDIIEIGDTVIVFLEDGVWNRGEALARLRNPLKAQELVGRIKTHHRSGRKDLRIPHSVIRPEVHRNEQGATKPTSGASTSRKLRKSVRRSGTRLAEPETFPDLEETLVDFIVHRAALLLTQNSSRLREIVRNVLTEVLRPVPGEAQQSAVPPLKVRIRSAVRARLEAKGAAAGQEKDGSASGKVKDDAEANGGGR